MSIAKVILSSGLVIPVSALDGMVEKVGDILFKNMKERDYHCYGEIDFNNLAQAAINAIKQEARKV